MRKVLLLRRMAFDLGRNDICAMLSEGNNNSNNHHRTLLKRPRPQKRLLLDLSTVGVRKQIGRARRDDDACARVVFDSLAF